MATFLDLQNEVKARVIDLPQVVEQLIPTFLNRALRSAQDRYNWLIMRGTVAKITTLDQSSLGPIPADWKDWREKPYGVDYLGSQWEFSIAVSSASLFTRIGWQDQGRPIFIRQSEPTEDVLGLGEFIVNPIPDGISDYPDGEYRIYIPYWRYLPALVNPGDTNWFTENIPAWLAYTAAQDAFGVDWDEERMTLWAQLAQREWAEKVRTDKLKQLQGVDTLVPVTEGVRGFRISR